EMETELLERRGEIVRIEERVISKEEAIDAKLADLSRREERLDDRERELEHQRGLLEERKREHLRELERVAGLSASQAKQVLLKEVEDQARHDAAKLLRQVDEETKLQAERRVRNILSVCMGRLAAAHASETTVSVVQLPSDDMKGRVIGREGRNIRALENLTGVDFIIDDTPHAVVLSGFDGVRRASAKTARRAALLHDIGKSVSHEVEGPHALVGGDLARKHGESEAVAHAMEAHHNEVEPQTVEAVLVQAADALSGARPGARGES